MRTFFTLLFFAFVACTNAQNYQAINPDRTAFFTGPMGVYPVRIDSLLASGDTTFLYPFSMIQGDGSGTAFQHGGHWLGYNIGVLANGNNFFINKDEDTILIRTLANSGETWQLYQFPDGRYIEATVSGLSWETFGDFSDSVKTITLAVKDSIGQPLIHPANSFVLKLSRNYGLIQTVGFYEFPDYPFCYPDYMTGTSLLLEGLTNPVEGSVQNIGYWDIYQREVGDETHTWRYYYPFFGTAPHYDKWEISILLDKYESGDTVIYTYDRCFRNVDYVPAYGYTQINKGHDTITSEILPGDSIFVMSLNSLPFIPYTTDGFSYTFNLQFDSMKVLPMDLIFQDIDSTDILMAIFVDGCCSNGYMRNFGGPCYEGYDSYGGQVGSKLVYYKRGTNTWGTPLVCNTLVSVNEEGHKTLSAIHPNPTSGIFTIDGEGQVIVGITDLSGKILVSNKKMELPGEMDCSFLCPGIYLITIKSKEGTLREKLIIE
jgi:hypothetical protein